MKRVNKLCCMELQTAAYVFGILGCVGSSLLILACIYGLIQIDKSVNDLERTEDEIAQIIELRIQVVVYLVMLIIDVITSFLLIMGATKKHHLFLLPWLIEASVYMVFLCFGCLYKLGQFLSNNTSFEIMLLYIVIDLLVLAFYFYIWYGVYSYYKNLKDARKENRKNIAFLNSEEQNTLS